MKCFKCGEETYGNICRKCEREEESSGNQNYTNSKGCGKPFNLYVECGKYCFGTKTLCPKCKKGSDKEKPK